MSITGAAGLKNLVASNFIGTDPAGHNLGNATGIVIDGNASNNTIGGTAAGAGNTIALNTKDGVDVNSGTGNAIRQNLIYGNTGHGHLPALIGGGTANNNQPAPSNLAIHLGPRPDDDQLHGHRHVGKHLHDRLLRQHQRWAVRRRNTGQRRRSR